MTLIVKRQNRQEYGSTHHTLATCTLQQIFRIVSSCYFQQTSLLSPNTPLIPPPPSRLFPASRHLAPIPPIPRVLSLRITSHIQPLPSHISPVNSTGRSYRSTHKWERPNNRHETANASRFTSTLTLFCQLPPKIFRANITTLNPVIFFCPVLHLLAGKDYHKQRSSKRFERCRVSRSHSHGSPVCKQQAHTHAEVALRHPDEKHSKFTFGPEEALVTKCFDAARLQQTDEFIYTNCNRAFNFDSVHVHIVKSKALYTPQLCVWDRFQIFDSLHHCRRSQAQRQFDQGNRHTSSQLSLISTRIQTQFCEFLF